jgi:predicted nucleic acid-binding protein
MAWVVDTCVLVDVLEGDPSFGEASAACIDKHLPAGLVVCPVTYIELAPAFLGDESREIEFLTRVGISCDEGWERADTRAAHAAWTRYIERKRTGKAPRRPLADILIGAFASRFDGLITRNPGDLKLLFKQLRIVEP